MCVCVCVSAVTPLLRHLRRNMPERAYELPLAVPVCSFPDFVEFDKVNKRIFTCHSMSPIPGNCGTMGCKGTVTSINMYCMNDGDLIKKLQLNSVVDFRPGCV